MQSFELSIPSQALQVRMMQRLRGGAPSASVVWSRAAHNVLVHAESLALRTLDGWLLVSLDLETDQTGRTTLQFVFHPGRKNNRNTLASCAINAATPEAAQLADGWGRDLQRVLWDAVLDGIEACLATVQRQAGEQPLMLAGFFTLPDLLVVNVLAGA